MKLIIRTNIMVLVMGLPMLAQAVEYYRYIDKNGVTAISRQGVPSEYIEQGYDVLNEQGRVIRTVPRAPTEAERRQLLKMKQQAQSDKHLLRLYTQVSDVDRARERKFAEIDGLVNIVRANLLTTNMDKAELLREAANMERAGEPVSQNLLQRIAVMERTETRLQQEIEQYQRQRKEAEKAFAKDKERVAHLLGKE